jgi:hypothetical protein
VHTDVGSNEGHFLSFCSFKHYIRTVVQKCFVQYLSLPCHPQRKKCSDSFSLLNRFSLALISIWAKLQFATLFLEFHQIHHRISLLYPFVFVPNEAYLHLGQMQQLLCICNTLSSQSLYYWKVLMAPIVVLIYMFLKWKTQSRCVLMILQSFCY